MKKLSSVMLVIVLSLAALAGRADDVIERIVATVNGRAILQSDWEEAICYEAFMDGRSLDKLTVDDRQATLDRLIDQELLRQQVQSSNLRQTSQQQIEQRIQEIRKLYPAAATEQGWRATLQTYGLNEQELERRISQQLELTRLIEARLLPSIQIDSRSIEIYYKETLIPQIRKSGGKQVSLAEVSPKIKEVLTQQKMNDLLVAWLRSLRADSRIQEKTRPARSVGDHHP
jgi:parvulin-like peptidyl-prolyl isomerase